ncbi:hypothetical protein BF49_0801 [Bradyrhizobium sp.]|nr:hypothetical protein BF49_0801 [Bradyrhizobium sp.]
MSPRKRGGLRLRPIHPTSWLAGFYAGRRNNPVVDTQALNKNGNKLSRFCESHCEMPLLDAVEANTK